ncbi:MAG: hypothetical protein ACRC2R_27440 [Xenococcaceae cyanobacterium]
MNKLSEYLLIILVFISKACGMDVNKDPSPVGDMICDKSNREIFYPCLIKNVPLGSSYQKLFDFLILHDFSSSHKYPKLDKNYRFYFIWSSNSLGNYKIGVIGHCNSQLKVIELELI